MRPRSRMWAPCRSLLVAALCLTGSRAPAQQPCLPPRPPQYYFPPPGYGPCVPAPAPPATLGLPAAPGATAERPGTGAPTAPGGTGTPEGAGAAAPAPTTDMGGGAGAAAASAAFAGLGSGAGVGSSVALAAPGGYLDNPVPINTFRLRYDVAYGMNRPDRADYFYATWQELGFHVHGLNHGGAFPDPHARGPEQLPANVNFQEPSAYAEWAFNRRLSAFVDVPLRYVDFTHLQEDGDPNSEMKKNPADFPNPGNKFFPEPSEENPNRTTNNPGGLSDIQFGVKAALIADPSQYLTFQFRTYAPSGSVSHGLGTGHWSVEPGLLWYHLVGQNAFLQAQFSDWVPLTQDPVAGNVLNYGLGFGYQVYRSENFRVVPITEVVGWTVLHGFESRFGIVDATRPAPNFELPTTHGVEDASGATIVNVKLGARIYFGSNNSFFGPGNSLYFGYGRAVTGSRWYQDIFRAEYRLTF